MKLRLKKLCMLLMAGVLVLGTVACGKETDSGDAKAKKEPTPQVGDSKNTMYISIEKESTSPDRVEFPWFNLRLPCILMYRSLVLANPAETEFAADMAEYQVSEDGTVYTFTMKEGLKWSDGEALTPADVSWSIKTALKAAQVKASYLSAFSYIKGSTEYKDGKSEDISGITIDGNTITMTLTSPYAYFMQELAQFSILPKHSLENEDPLTLYQSKFWSAPVTSGFYKFDEMKPGSYYSLSLNENYEGTKPQIENVVCNYAATQTTAITSGASDYAFTNAPSDIEVLNADKNLTAYYNDFALYRYMTFNIEGTDGNKNPAMEDKRVREAVAYAIDRESLAKVYGDIAKITYSGVAVDDPANDGTVYKYDPEKAKKLLKEAGWDPNYTVRFLYYSSDDTSANVVAAISQYLQNVGMKVESTYTSQATQDYYTTRDYDIGFAGTGPLSQYYAEYSSKDSLHPLVWGDDTSFDPAIQALSSSLDEEQVKAAKEKLQTLEKDTMYKLPLVTLGYYTYLNTARLEVPAEVKDMGTPGHRCDIQFEKWTIK